MNGITIAIGAAVFAFGIFSGIMRFIKPSYFRKLEPMKKMWGARAGSVIHFIGYVVVPVVIGVGLVISGIKGANIFEAFK
jgi:hypothetical protein